MCLCLWFLVYSIYLYNKFKLLFLIFRSTDPFNLLSSYPSTHLPTNQPAHSSTNQLINQPTHPSTNQLTNQPTNPPIYYPTHQTTNPPTIQPTHSPPTAQVNANLPRTFGDSTIHQSHIDVMVEEDRPLPTAHIREISKEELKIGYF